VFPSQSISHAIQQTEKRATPGSEIPAPQKCVMWEVIRMSMFILNVQFAYWKLNLTRAMPGGDQAEALGSLSFSPSSQAVNRLRLLQIWLSLTSAREKDRDSSRRKAHDLPLWPDVTDAEEYYLAE